MRLHVDNGVPYNAWALYKKMRELGVSHDGFTFPIVNRAISALEDANLYLQMVHGVAKKMGLEVDLYFYNTLIEAFSKSGSTYHAAKVFEDMPQRDLVSWTSMIAAWLHEGIATAAIDLFNSLRKEFEPNSVTMMILLQGCCASEMLSVGRQLHCYLTKNGFIGDAFVRNSVLRMYTKAGTDVEEVESFFSELDYDDVVSWNILISFYSFRGGVEKVLIIFRNMQARVQLSVETLTAVISALADSADLLQGEKLHNLALQSGLCDDVLRTSLLDLYAKCGEIENSIKLFDEIAHRNNITWNAMISGFVQNGYLWEAINLFHQMIIEGHEVGSDIYRSLIDASAHIGALHLGKEIHGNLVRNSMAKSMEENRRLQTSMLNMYVKCGDISFARRYFNTLFVKDVITWSSMVEGYGSHGFGEEAIRVFHLMIDEGIRPNEVTFLSLLGACSHSSLLSEGYEVFSLMKWTFGIEPNLDHYTCFVDMLARSGRVRDALSVIMKMVHSPDGRIWGAILAASRIHGDKKIGEFAAEKLLELESDNVGYRTLLSNIRASGGHWSEVEAVRNEMDYRELKKKPGWSCLMNNGEFHGFVTGDTTHEKSEIIYETVQKLSRNIQQGDGSWSI